MLTFFIQHLFRVAGHFPEFPYVSSINTARFFFFFGKKLLKAITSGMLEILQTRSSGKTDDRVIEVGSGTQSHLLHVSYSLQNEPRDWPASDVAS